MRIVVRDLMRGVGAIIVGIILIVAGVCIYGVFLFITVDANELCEDWDTTSGKFDSYDAGDEITIVDVINDIRYVPEHMVTGEYVDWTFITLKSVDLKIGDIASLAIQPSNIWGFIVFNGDLTDDYKEGDRIEIKVKVINFELMGQTGEILDWYEDLMDAALQSSGSSADVSYSDLELANENSIQKSNYAPEIMTGIIIVIGVIVLIIGVIKAVRARRAQLAEYYRNAYSGQSQQPTGLQSPYPGYSQPSRDQYQPGDRASITTTDIPRADYQSERTYGETQQKFMCPSCGNVMTLNVPHTPYRIHCDKCGISGIIN